jgi:hypothetical protein
MRKPRQFVRVPDPLNKEFYMKNSNFVWLLGTLALALSLVPAGCKFPDDPIDPVGPHTVTFSPGTGGGTPPASMTVEHGHAITLPGQGNMTAPEGKSFQGWIYSSTS